MKILRIKEVTARTGLTRSPFYAQMADGLWTKPVKIGARCVGWPDNEIDRLIASRIRGETPDQIRRLVSELHRLRSMA